MVRGLDVRGVAELLRGLGCVFAYAEPTDMRKSLHTLSALDEREMKRDALEGTLFLTVVLRQPL